MLLEKLEGLKRDAQEDGEPKCLKMNGVPFLVRPTGFKVGGGKGSFHAYVLEAKGISLGLQRRQRPHEETPNVHVDVGSLVLMDLGGLGPCWDLVEVLIGCLGGDVMWDKVSRVDVCVDLVDVDVEDFVRLMLEKQCIKRARKCGYWEDGDRWTGFQLGKGAIVGRVYDKLLEVLHDARKLAVLVARRWGKHPDAAARVEFQLRREAFRSFGIDSVKDYLRERAALVRYLADEWLRFTAEKIDRTHTTRAEVHPLWAKVQEAFSEWAGRSAAVVKRSRKVRINAYALVKQGIGCLVSAVTAQMNGQLLDYGEFVSEMRILTASVLERMDLYAEMERRYVKWDAEGPSAFSKEAWLGG